MPIRFIRRGSTITLTAFFHDLSGNQADGVGVEITITDPNGATVVDLATPTHIDTGQYQYDFPVSSTALLGVWSATWTGTINSTSVENASPFEVLSGSGDDERICTPWTDVATVRACCSGLPASGTLPDETVDTAIAVATDILYTMSGQQFSGICQEVVRPCGGGCFNAWWSSWGWSVGSDLSISSYPNPADPSSYPAPECSCRHLPSVDLGLWPLETIVEVIIDGVVVDPSTYRIDEKRYLVRLTDPTTGDNPGWPTCQRLDLPITEVGTWQVTAQYGTPAPAAGQNAAAKLACEFAKACAGIPCSLPARATNINRQQINISLLDPAALQQGITGLYEVDLFVLAYNPGKSRGQTVVWTPDIATGVRRTGP